jgi:hypothetical protein
MRTRLILLSLTLFACSLLNPGTPTVDTRPNDFSVVYNWYEGSLPPPYHYEYTIFIAADGAGTVTMIPDYPGDDVPIWTETFALDAAALDALYAKVAAQGAFTTRWREEDDPPVGGSHFATSLTAHGETLVIPSFVPSGQAAAQGEISDAIVAAVPPEIWAALEAQREQYVEEHGG